MASDLKIRLAAVFLLSVVGAYVAVPTSDKPLFRDGGTFAGKVIRLGLDLQGGAEMTVVVDPTGEDRKKSNRSIADLAEECRGVLERRINIRGLKEPVIRRQGTDKILIQLPGIDEEEVGRVRSLLQKSGRLEFRLVARERDMEQWDGPHNGAPAGYEWLEWADRQEGGGRPYLLCEIEPRVTGDEIEDARPELDTQHVAMRRAGTGLPYQINFRLDTFGSRKFEKATGENVGLRLAIVLDGKVQSAPTIKDRISREGVITGGSDGYTEAEAQELAVTLRSGSLPCRVAIEGEGAVSYVGATLGEDSIRSGTLACLLAFVAVAIFMLAYYRGCGIVAVVSLLLNLVFILAIMGFFSATLTLPGIAGLILTIGMAVDGNILVFERIREEKEKGKTPAQAFEAGHERAFVTIVDSNLTTLAAGLILYVFGSGPVQGFAVTTSVGILTTLFTVLFCSKTLLRFAMAVGWLRTFSMGQVMRKPSFTYTRWLRPCAIGSLVVIAAGLAAIAARGPENWSIDFLGGTVVQPRFLQPIGTDDLRRELSALRVTDREGRTVEKYPDLEIQSVVPPEEGKSLGQGLGNMLSNLARTGSREHQLKTSRVYPGLAVEPIHEPTLKDPAQPDVTRPNPFHGGLALTFVPAQKTDAAAVEAVVKGALPAPAAADAGATPEPPPQVSVRTASAGPAFLPPPIEIRLTARQAAARDAVVTALRGTPGIVNSLRDDVLEKFRDKLSPPAFGPDQPGDPNPRSPYHGGRKVPVRLQAPVAASAVEGVLKGLFPGDTENVFRVEAAAGDAPAVELTLSAAAWGRFEEIKAALREASRRPSPPFLLSKDPFQKEATVGGAVARELKENAIIAGLLSWAVIILYLAVRFRSWLYGIAAVVALVHDVLVALGVVALVGLAVPSSWGLHFEFSLQTVAAAMTIIGFSVNDTIVIFDRVRENRNLLRKEPIRSLIDLSVNQTMSRTILTSLTVLMSVVLLYGVTMRSSGGIADFAFPMIVGVVAGTYSTVFIAAPFLLLGRKEEGAAKPAPPVSVS